MIVPDFILQKITIDLSLISDHDRLCDTAFRDYFLSDRHICPLNNNGGDGTQGTNEQQCIVCEMSRLFQEFYSGGKSPLVPHVLLHMTWEVFNSPISHLNLRFSVAICRNCLTIRKMYSFISICI